MAFGAKCTQNIYPTAANHNAQFVRSSKQGALEAIEIQPENSIRGPYIDNSSPAPHSCPTRDKDAPPKGGFCFGAGGPWGLIWTISCIATGSSVRLWRSVVVMLLSAGVAGCAYHSLGPIDDHYAQFKARMPERDSVFVCSAYGCRTQTQFRFTSADIATLQLMMSEKKTATPADERKAVAATLAWMERRVGDVVGTSADRPGDDLAGNGDPTQMDCVDIATNLTSYLLILERHQLLRHHRVGSVFAKEDLRRGISGWLHFAAILVENTIQARVRRRRLATGEREAAGDCRKGEVVHRRFQHRLW